VIENQVSPANLAKQKQTAESIKKYQPGLEQIKFTQDGNVAVFGGSWAVNAVLTISGKEYQEILEVDGAMAGDPTPGQRPQPTLTPVKVIYSDGSTEVLP
jgi:hypothetical protein